MNTVEWQWDEMKQVGTDYTDLEQIGLYDERMGRFRDVEGENRETLKTLALASGASVLEIGCGTGRFARAAAAAGLAVTAVDVSAPMLEYVRHKSRAEGLPEIVTRHAGFLTMEFAESSFDAAVSGLALHHLPDAWKLVALRNIARVLKPGGQLILRDVVFVLKQNEAPETCFQRFVDSFPTMKQGSICHVSQEFSVYDWIVEGLLERAGFAIVSKRNPAESLMVYHCRKNGAF